MSVYVDELWEHGRTSNMPYPVSCHMTADTKAELMEFAKKLGLKPEWLHKSSSMHHFDITPNKRALALKLGAVDMPGNHNIREKVQFFKRIRDQWAQEQAKEVLG